MPLRLQPLVITLLCIFLPVLTFHTTYEGYFSLILKVMILILHQMEKPTLQVAANLVQYFIENGPLEVRKKMIDSLTMFLVEVGEAGEASEEFMELYYSGF